MAYWQIISLIEARLSSAKANLVISLTAIYTHFRIVLRRCLSATDLQKESNASPRQRCMNWIILNCDISDLFEKVNPLNDLAKKIPNDDCLSALPPVSPSLLDTLLF
jgi:hypothetical protein